MLSAGADVSFVSIVRRHGAVRAPLNASDFASYLLQAQNSGAQVLGLANAGPDFSNAL